MVCLSTSTRISHQCKYDDIAHDGVEEEYKALHLSVRRIVGWARGRGGRGSLASQRDATMLAAYLSKFDSIFCLLACICTALIKKQCFKSVCLAAQLSTYELYDSSQTLSFQFVIDYLC